MKIYLPAISLLLTASATKEEAPVVSLGSGVSREETRGMSVAVMTIRTAKTRDELRAIFVMADTSDTCAARKFWLMSNVFI